MMSTFPTYAFGESGEVVAFHGNHVIAKGTDFEKVAGTAEEYFNTLRKEHKKQASEVQRKVATHITTPNGDKGVILGRASGLWSDEITVRFENGQIRRYATFVEDGLQYSNDETGFGKTAAATPVDSLQHRLDEAIDPGRQGLTARLNDLKEIRENASRLASQGVSYTDGKTLHQIVLTADAERNEVQEALDYLIASDTEAMVAPTQAYSAVEQVDLGRSDSWLEVVAQEMIAESEAQDFDRLLSEGPTEFVSRLDTTALANTGAVREMAVDLIHTKTAGFKGEAVEQYREQFVASAELARKRELAYRKDAAQTVAKKEAKTIKDIPDEALFLS